MLKVLSPLFRLSLGTLGYLYATITATSAQVTSDGTVNTQVNQNGSVAEITGGETRGGNLFHSFQDFSVPTGNEAFFNNAESISNIFSRVTGGNISNIDGLIGANGTANLFLINPAGILFGENARLDIGGSFFGTTADSILFEDGEFSATNPDNSPLLTINAPIGLNLRDNPGEIVNRSRVDDIGLQVASGKSISLIGGDINLEGGLITAPGGIVELGGLSTSGTINLNENRSVSFPEGIERSDISLTQQAAVNVRAGGSGFINIDAKNLLLTEQSELFAGIAENSGSETAVAGDINIRATESVKIIGEVDAPTGENFEQQIQAITFARDNGTGIRNNVGLSSVRRGSNTDRSNALGNGGDINITTQTLEMLNTSVIDTGIFGTGAGGDININADNITLTGSQSFFLAQVRGFNLDRIKEQGIGDGGSLNINTGSIDFNESAGILLDVQPGAVGNSGDIIITASNEVNFIGGEEPSFVLTQLSGGSIGSAGDIKITASFLKLDNAQLISNIGFNAQGDGGNIEFNIANTALIDGSQIQAQVQQNATGNGGDIIINAGNLQVTDSFSDDSQQSLILADTQGRGNAGNITFNITDSFTVDRNSLILTQVQQNAFGKAGSITINASSLNLLDNSLVLADTRGEGDSGNIIIDASNNIIIDDSLILTELGINGIGKAGNIDISAADITIDNLSIVSSKTRTGATGESGSVSIDSDFLRLANGSSIDAITENQFDAGNVTLATNTIEIISGGKIITATDDSGNAGNITLEVAETLNINGENPLLRLESTTVPAIDALNAETGLFANTTARSIGNGGTIQINNVDSLNINNDAKISVASEGEGSGGSIFVNSDFLNLSNGAEVVANTAFGTGGNVNLTVENHIVLEDNSLVSAEATGTANGGNLNIDTDFIIAFPDGNNDILASAEQGTGGNITINAQSLLGIQESPLSDLTNDINASSEFDLDGSIIINTLGIDPLQGAAELPQNVVEPEQTTAQACNVNRSIATNSLIVRGRGGILAEPGLPLDSSNIIGANADATSAIPKPIETAQGKIQPARGIKVTEDGTITLTAYRTNNAGERLFKTNPNCS